MKRNTIIDLYSKSCVNEIPFYIFVESQTSVFRFANLINDYCVIFKDV